MGSDNLCLTICGLHRATQRQYVLSRTRTHDLLKNDIKVIIMYYLYMWFNVRKPWRNVTVQRQTPHQPDASCVGRAFAFPASAADEGKI